MDVSPPERSVTEDRSRSKATRWCPHMVRNQQLRRVKESAVNYQRGDEKWPKNYAKCGFVTRTRVCFDIRYMWQNLTSRKSHLRYMWQII